MAAAIEYEFAFAMSNEQLESLGIRKKGEWAPVQQPYEGINKMLDGMATLLAIDLLDPSEQKAIEVIYERLRGLGEEGH